MVAVMFGLKQTWLMVAVGYTRRYRENLNVRKTRKTVNRSNSLHGLGFNIEPLMERSLNFKKLQKAQKGHIHSSL